MGAIYCLYSKDEGQPRYVGQTTGEVRYRFKQHVTRALEHEPGLLYEWMRNVWRKNQTVECHVLQDSVIPNDLELYERYWMDQFAGLVNVRNNIDNNQNTDIGERIKVLLQSEAKG